ncbi:GNAT family N-acetyltransferase [Streptomyces radiopugnans]|uniref:GNAT family N-acetyltransferase n=1 Tax=Streptomyces radiopugnans TaxID=403935 RepID=UPI003F1D98A9
MGLREEAEKWLAASGIDQWRDPATRGPALVKWRADIAAGRTWVVEDHSAITATITLTGPDLDFWHPEDAPQSAIYVAKLITTRSAAGNHLGGRLLDFACRKAQAAALPWVRLDCWRDNERLQRFYLHEGFQHVRTEAPKHRKSGWLGQRPADVIRYPSEQLNELDAHLSSKRSA